MSEKKQSPSKVVKKKYQPVNKNYKPRFELSQAILGVLLPPLRLYLNRGTCDVDVLLDLCIILIWPISVIFSFGAVDKMDICVNIWCTFLPPLGVFLGHSNRFDFDVIACCAYTLLLWIPGMVYAYWTA